MGTQGGGTGSGGTGSGGTGSGGTGTGGGQTFNTQVAPLVTGCVSCHNGGQPPNLSSFMALDAKYKAKPGANNILVKRGAHTGPALAATSVTQIAAWIDSLP
jgi:hypothetical protein